MMVAMTERYRTASGWSVEIVRRTATPDHHDGESLRVCQFGCYVADVRTPVELERYFPLAELEPDSLRAVGSSRRTGLLPRCLGTLALQDDAADTAQWSLTSGGLPALLRVRPGPSLRDWRRRLGH